MAPPELLESKDPVLEDCERVVATYPRLRFAATQEAPTGVLELN